MIELWNLIVSSLFSSCTPIFRYLGINYAQNIYIAYDNKINFHLRLVLCVINGSAENVNAFTKLAEFCLNLHQFVELEKTICPNETDLKINGFCIDLRNAMLLWLKEHIFGLIEREIDSDNLQLCNESLKLSMSAEKISNIFKQMRNMFEHPEQLSSVEKDKFCLQILKSFSFYASKMSELNNKLLQKREDENFQIPSEWCVIINNVNHVRRNVQSLIELLGFNLNVGNLTGAAKINLQNYFDEVSVTIENITETLLQKMDTAIIQNLKENSTPEAINLYMAKSFKKLSNLVEKDQFERVLSAMFNKLLEKCQEMQKPLEFYVDIRANTKKIFDQQNILENSIASSMKTIDDILELCKCETSQLIHLYYLERHRIQQEIPDSPCDILKCQFLLSKTNIRITDLKIEVKDGKQNNLDYKSYVKIKLSPEMKFPDHKKLKTKLATGHQILKYENLDFIM